MRRILIIILTAVILGSCHSISGSGNIISETRHTGEFHGVKTSGSMDIEVLNSNSPFIKIEADDNVMPYIITNVEDGILNVHLKSNQSYHNVNVKVYVSAPVFEKLIVSGSGSITAKDTLNNSDKIECKISGSGDINAMVDAPLIIAAISGSGTITLQGRTKDFNCSIGGSGDLNCKNLLSENTIVKISGSGTAHVFASVSLQAKTSGSGDIYYSGNPQTVNKSGNASVEAEK